MKDNKSPGVDGIPPKLLMETVDQISIPLARVFNLSLKEGVVPFEWKEANIIPLFKKTASGGLTCVGLVHTFCWDLIGWVKDYDRPIHDVLTMEVTIYIKVYSTMFEPKHSQTVVDDGIYTYTAYNELSVNTSYHSREKKSARIL